MISLEKAKTITRLLDNKKATDIAVLNVGSLTSLGDYFVIASGSSTTQVKTLAEEVEEKLSLQGVEPERIEGENTAAWILMDYGDVIVHIFLRDTRDFYCLERLWADAEKLDVEAILGEQQ